MPSFQLHCGILSVKMTSSSSNKRYIQVSTLVCVLLIVLQLVLQIVDAETSKRDRTRNIRASKNSNSKRIDNNHSHRHTESAFREEHSSNSRRHPSKRTNNRRAGHHNQARTNEIESPEESFHEVSEFEQYAASKEAKRNLRIEQIKENILRQLNLGSPPNVSGIVETTNPSVRAMINDVAEANSKMPHANDVARDVPPKRTFIPVEESYPFNYQLPEGVEVMYFKLNEGEVSMAELHLWIKPIPLRNAEKVAVIVSKVGKPAAEGDLVRYTEVSRNIETIRAEKGDWTKINIINLVSEWTKDTETNLGLVVEMQDSEGNQMIVTNASEIPSKAPLLEVQFTHEGPSHRPTRSSEGGKCSNGETRCCKFPLPINFTEYSFDFIVAPKVYMANFCNGKCGYLYAQQAIHQTVVQKLQNSTATYGPCCGAKELMPLNMLYYDHDRKIRFDTINDMVIEKCSCD